MIHMHFKGYKKSSRSVAKLQEFRWTLWKDQSIIGAALRVKISNNQNDFLSDLQRCQMVKGHNLPWIFCVLLQVAWFVQTEFCLFFWLIPMRRPVFWSRKRRKWRWGSVDDLWSSWVVHRRFVDLKDGLTLKERRWLGQYVIIRNVKRCRGVGHQCFWRRQYLSSKILHRWIWYCKPHGPLSPNLLFAVGSDPKIAVGSYSKLCSHVIVAPSDRHYHY